jgi:hypothetical protein
MWRCSVRVAFAAATAWWQQCDHSSNVASCLACLLQVLDVLEAVKRPAKMQSD